MARKKIDNEDPKKKGEIDVDAKLRNMFGDGVIVTADEIVEATKEIVSVSPVLDLALGGGVMAGSMVTLSGPAGCGKTTTALEICTNWQALDREVYYVAAEARLNPRDLENIEKLDRKRLKVIRSTEDHILTAQETLQSIDLILSNKRDVCVCVDSFSILCDADEMSEENYDKLKPAATNRIVGSFCRRVAPKLPIKNNLLIGIFHVYANIGGHTAWKSAVPSKVEFTRSTGLHCNWAEPLTMGEDKKPYGQIAHWKVERSMLEGGATGNKADSIIRFGVGIDRIAEITTLATDLGLVRKKGAWVYFTPTNSEEEMNFMGGERFRTYLEDNPEQTEALYGKVREMLF